MPSIGGEKLLGQLTQKKLKNKLLAVLEPYLALMALKTLAMEAIHLNQLCDNWDISFQPST
jgi:hypothetical protein